MKASNEVMIEHIGKGSIGICRECGGGLEAAKGIYFDEGVPLIKAFCNICGKTSWLLDKGHKDVIKLPMLCPQSQIRVMVIRNNENNLENIFWAGQKCISCNYYSCCSVMKLTSKIEITRYF